MLVRLTLEQNDLKRPTAVLVLSYFQSPLSLFCFYVKEHKSMYRPTNGLKILRIEGDIMNF